MSVSGERVTSRATNREWSTYNVKWLGYPAIQAGRTPDESSKPKHEACSCHHPGRFMVNVALT